MTNELFQKMQQDALAAERRRLKTLIQNDLTPLQRAAAKERVADIDSQTKMEGYLSAKGLRPPT